MGTFVRFGVPVIGVAFLGSTAAAATIRVPEDMPSIQMAVGNATHGDVILVGPGTWTGFVSFAGKSVRLESTDGPDVTVIDALGNGTVLRQAGNGTVIKGFTVRGGAATLGGGIDVNGTSPTIVHCAFVENFADYGGAAYLRNGARPWFIQCDFDGNWAGYGGAVYARDASDAAFEGCDFAANWANVGAGGAVHVYNAAPSFTDCAFDGNEALDQAGGALYGQNANVALSRCRLDGNHAGTNGGALAFSGGAPRVDSCTFADNHADYGGAIYGYNHSGSFANCRLVGNTASYGGGVFHVAGVPMFVNCTVVGNIAYGLGGAFRVVNALPTIANSVLWDNAPQEVSAFQSLVTLTHSCIEGGWAGAGSGNVSSSPSFVDQAGGDLRLAPDSPCIDAGDLAMLPPDDADLNGDGDRGEPLPLDLDGHLRALGATVDMGAYEADALPCAADLDGSGDVGFADLLAVISAWGACPANGGCAADLNADGLVGIADLIVVMSQWGPCAG